MVPSEDVCKKAEAFLAELSLKYGFSLAPFGNGGNAWKLTKGDGRSFYVVGSVFVNDATRVLRWALTCNVNCMQQDLPSDLDGNGLFTKNATEWIVEQIRHQRVVGSYGDAGKTRANHAKS